MENPDPIHAHPQSRDTHEPITAHQDAVQQVNKFHFAQTALSTVAIIFSCLALGAVVMHAILYPQIVDAKIQAGAAKAEATAHAADVNARVAVDEIERMRTALAAQKIVIPKSHD